MHKNSLQFRELLRLSFRTFKTKPTRAGLTILGMAVGIATVLILISLGYGLQYILIGKLITTEDSLVTMEATYPSESNLFIRQNTIDMLTAYPNVAEVSPVAQFPGELYVGASSSLLVDTLLVEPNYYRLSGSVATVGGVPKESSNGVVLSSQTLAALGFSSVENVLNSPLQLKVFYQDDVTGTSEEASSSVSLPVSGVIVDESLAPQVIAFADSMSAEPPFFRKVLVKARDAEAVIRLRDQLIEDGFIVSARIDLVNQARKITNIITIVLGVFGITALVVSAIGMFNTMIVGFMERTYEVGILKSLGATDTDVRNLFLTESIIMGILGGLCGIVIGLTGSMFLNFSVSLLSVKLGGEQLTLFMTPWWFLAFIMVLSLLIGFLSGLWPAYRATKLSPKEAFTRR